MKIQFIIVLVILLQLLLLVKTQKKKAFIHSNSVETVERINQYFLKNSDKWELLDNKIEENAYKADFIWKSRFVWNRQKPFQWFNHNPLQVQYNNKGLCKNIIEKYEKKQNVLAADEVLPKTYILSLLDPQETEEEKQFFSEKNKNKYWIIKPINGKKGEGIFIENDIDRLKKLFLSKKPKYKKSDYGLDRESWIVQQYIHKPLLINNRKFDIRCYLHFLSFKPMVALYYPGYLRRSIVDYDINDLNNLHGHLVNVNLQKQLPQYEEEAFESLWSMDKFKEHMINNENISELQYEQMLIKLKLKLAYMAEALKNYSDANPGQAQRNQFQLFGLDVTFDENLDPIVTDANIDPQLLNPHEGVKEHQLKMLNGIFEFQSKTIENAHRLQSFFENLTQEVIDKGDEFDSEFTLLYNQVTRYSYLKNHEKDIPKGELRKPGYDINKKSEL